MIQLYMKTVKFMIIYIIKTCHLIRKCPASMAKYILIKTYFYKEKYKIMDQSKLLMDFLI